MLNEENSALKHTVSQLQLQQEDLENREFHQNLHIQGVLETVSDNNLCSYLLGLFNTLAPDMADKDWSLDGPIVPWPLNPQLELGLET